MRYAVSIPPFTDPHRVVEMAVTAERTGWDAVFLWDHLQWSDQVQPDVHDPWALLGAIAVRTGRVRIGTLVTPLSRRRVHVVARHVLTLDHLSGGRVTLGVGLGAPAEEDFAAFGDEPDGRVRAAILDEQLVVLDGLLRGGRVDHDGHHVTVHGTLRPGPIQRPRPPIWVAGVVPHRRPLRRARAWEGVAPIGSEETLTPAALAAYLGGPPPPGWDVVVPRSPGVTVEEYAAVGTTWLVDSAWPHEPGWADDLAERIARGPGGP